MGRVLCNGRTAVSVFVLTAALAPACGDDDSADDPRRMQPDAGRDARSDVHEDARNQQDSAPETGADTGHDDARSGDAGDAGETSDAARLDASAADAGADARSDSSVTEAGSDVATLALDAAVEAEAEAAFDGAPDASDGAVNADSSLPDAASDANPADGASAPLVFWRVGQDFACEGTRAQVECSDDDFAEAYVITILQSAGGSCPGGPSRIAVYFQHGSVPVAGEYIINPLTNFSDASEARLDVDVNNGASAWVAQSGQISVELVDGTPSLSFSGVPARFGNSDTTLSGRVTCPPDS